MKESSRSNWEQFWEEKKDVHHVYSNQDRVLRNLLPLTDLKGKRVLEIGAGTGRDSFTMTEYGALVVQLDYAEASLRILKRLAEEMKVESHIVAGDGFRMPFRDATFDIVFHQGLLEHFRRPEADRLLKENIRVLKRGGLLLVDVPQRYHIYTLAKHVLIAANRWFAGWERSFSVSELRADLRRLGLTPVFSYGEWMVPSFFYRSLREVLRNIGIRLPLVPQSFKSLTRLRSFVRSALLKTSLPLYTGISIGVVGRK